MYMKKVKLFQNMSQLSCTLFYTRKKKNQSEEYLDYTPSQKMESFVGVGKKTLLGARWINVVARRRVIADEP